MKLFSIRTQKFNYDKFIYFHGWIYLSPFSVCDDKSIDTYLRLKKGKSIKVKIKTSEGDIFTTITISTQERKEISEGDRDVLKGQIKRMFCLDQDFTEFHNICRNIPDLNFVHTENCKGMLRSPNAFEDLIKTICTTNCDWRNTKKMCSALCSLDGGNIPTPKEILRYNEPALSKLVPLGYRAKTVLEVSRLTDEGKLDLDKWAKEKDYSRIRKSLISIWGIGDYCVNHLLVMLGDFSFIPIDSEVLKYLRETYFRGRQVSEKEAVKPFEQFQEYKYLVYKYERMARKLNYINKV